jgi:TRAP-type C4-dicarboxylate transport system substrate-binding protein
MWRRGEGDEFLKRKLDQVPPERREEFRRNFERWKKMSPEQRDAIRKQEREHRERICREVDAAINQSGLTLNEKQREQFTKRYAQERRKIERQIQKEMETRRRPLIKEMVERLGREFTAEPAASPSPAAEPSASPSAD